MKEIHDYDEPEYKAPIRCNRCGIEKGLKAFAPTMEEPDHTPIFCETCFMSDECTADEPMTKLEKAEMWLDKKFIDKTQNGTEVSQD